MVNAVVVEYAMQVLVHKQRGVQMLLVKPSFDSIWAQHCFWCRLICFWRVA